MLRRTLYALILVAVLAFALPAWAASYLWTNANLCECWNVATNWTPNAAGGPTDGDIVTFDGNEAEGNLPDSQLLGGGNTVGFVFTAAYTTTIEDMLNGAAIGTVTVNHASAVITAGANITGAITIPSGALNIAAARTLGGTIAIEAGGELSLDASGTVTASDTIAMSAGSLLRNVSGTVLDIAATKSLTGTATGIVNAGTIQGTVNMTACNWTGDGIITVNEDGILNLGDDTDNDQDVTVTAETVTIGDSFTCDSFTLNAAAGGAALTGADKTITADDVTYTDGALDAAGTLNVEMVGTGDIAWNYGTTVLGTVTFSGTTTAGNKVKAQKFAGSGSIAMGIYDTTLKAVANEFWTFDGTWTGTAIVYLQAAAARSNTEPIDVGGMKWYQGTYGTTATYTGGLSCAELAFKNDDASADMDGGNLTVAGDVLFDKDDSALSLGEGTHTIGGEIKRVTGDETGCSIDFETSHVTLGDDVTLAFAETDGTVDFGSAIIEASATITIDGTDAATIANTDGVIFANAQALTVSNVDYATASAPIICVSCVDGTGNGAGVEFQVPQRTMMGIGF